jgi:type IV pilus assembly protein PilY1
VDIDAVAGPLDTAKRITSPPNIALDDLANLWIYFGTGQFLGASDKNHTDTGAFYAIKDGCWDGTCTSPFTNLLDVSTAVVMTDQTVSGVSGSCSGIPAINTFTNLSYAIDRCYDGWAMYFSQVSELLDFTSAALSHAGERVVSEPVVVGGLAAFPSYIPGAGDLCSIEGDSNVYATFYKTGTGYKDYLFVEQKLKEAGNTSPVAVARVKVLGKGMPSTMAIQITKSGDAKGYAQSSTGAILEIETKTPFSLQGGTTGWKSEELQ